jgi:uncharacterized protein with FMN-binding domain
MRRPTAVVLGTFTAAVLMTVAKLGTPPPPTSETVAEAPLDGGLTDLALPGQTAGPSDRPSLQPDPSAPPQPGASRTGSPRPAAETTTAAPPPATGLGDGSFTGPAITHKYGTLQVSITVADGAISDVSWTYTTSLPLSKKINADALPGLRSETLSIQSAQVHTVSGATYTSNAYRTSLQSAIDRAK